MTSDALGLAVGLEIRTTRQVTVATLAHAYGNEGLEVFATPALLGLMELSCIELVQPYLSEEKMTVGTLVRLEHLASTPLGFTVTAHSRLVAMEGRRLKFELEVFDQSGEKIAQGQHERFIVSRKTFLERVQAKAGAQQ